MIEECAKVLLLVSSTQDVLQKPSMRCNDRILAKLAVLLGRVSKSQNLQAVWQDYVFQTLVELTAKSQVQEMPRQQYLQWDTADTAKDFLRIVRVVV